ncbi:hypothetical protein EON65_06775, partial [archaeon]
MSSPIMLSSFRQFVETITALPNASKANHGTIIRQLLNYVKPFLSRVAGEQGNLMELNWYKTEVELRKFLSRHNT